MSELTHTQRNGRLEQSTGGLDTVVTIDTLYILRAWYSDRLSWKFVQSFTVSRGFSSTAGADIRLFDPQRAVEDGARREHFTAAANQGRTCERDMMALSAANCAAYPSLPQPHRFFFCFAPSQPRLNSLTHPLPFLFPCFQKNGGRI